MGAPMEGRIGNFLRVTRALQRIDDTERLHRLTRVETRRFDW